MRIRALREKAGISQRQVAESLGISQAAYSRLETGEVEVSLNKLFVLAEMYGLTLQKLIEGI
jgi:transcriptional regulator with XRE-family HTH domain